MSDKMREAFEEKFPVPKGIAWKDSGNYGVILRTAGVEVAAVIYRAQWEGWQAAQSAAVPVVGDVVAWECKDYGDGWIIFQDKEIAENYQRQSGCLMNKLVIQPTTSITAAELSELFERIISAQGFTDEKLMSLMKRTLP